MAFVAGMGSGKEKGIALLEAATRDPEARVDASAVLMLIYSREGRHAEVVRIAHAPWNRVPAKPSVATRGRRGGHPGRAGG